MSPPAKLLRGSWGQPPDSKVKRRKRKVLRLPRSRSSGHDAVLPIALRLVERAVGGRHQALTDSGLRVGRDAQADGDPDARAVGREDRPFLERAACALGQAGRAVE